MGARKQSRRSPTLETVRRMLFADSKDHAGPLHDGYGQAQAHGRENVDADDVIVNECEVRTPAGTGTGTATIISTRKTNGTDSVSDSRTPSHFGTTTFEGRTTSGSEEALSRCGVLGISLLVICLAFIAATFASPQHFELNSIKLKSAEGALYLHWQEDQKIYLLGLLTGTALSAIFGFTCCCFSWTITYFDSLEPGQIPPTPLSPRKYRKQSGHSFHITYVVSILNGLAVFLYSLWHTMDSFLFV